jgi:hypothetical protein
MRLLPRSWFPDFASISLMDSREKLRSSWASPRLGCLCKAGKVTCLSAIRWCSRLYMRPRKAKVGASRWMLQEPSCAITLRNTFLLPSGASPRQDFALPSVGKQSDVIRTGNRTSRNREVRPARNVHEIRIGCRWVGDAIFEALRLN